MGWLLWASRSRALQVAQKTLASKQLMARVNVKDPVIRFVAWIVAVAAAIRVTFELIWPVLPYLAGAVALVGIARLISWYRGRW